MRDVRLRKIVRNSQIYATYVCALRRSCSPWCFTLPSRCACGPVPLPADAHLLLFVVLASAAGGLSRVCAVAVVAVPPFCMPPLLTALQKHCLVSWLVTSCWLVPMLRA